MEFRDVKIGEFANVLSGYAFKSKEFTEDGIPIIKIKNIRVGSIDLDDVQFVDVGYLDLDQKFHVQKGDLLISLTGSHLTQPNSVVGRVARYSGPHALLNQRAGKIIFESENICDRKFLYYLLSTLEYKRKLALFASGAASQANISPSQVESLEVKIPEIGTQQEIASILSAFDDLIENNCRRIEILEVMARRVYREWFVHFRYPGHEDDELVDSGSELGEIPEGWEVKKLLDVCNLQTGKALKSKQFNEDDRGVKAVRIRNVRTNSSDTYTDEDFDDKYLVENGDILVGMDGDFHMCKWADGQSVLVQRVARFRPKKEIGLSRYFFYWAIKKPIDYFNRTITGTTVAHLGKKHIKTIEILLPPDNLRKYINEVLNPMYEQVLALGKQNKMLKEIRNLLLPKLISGEIDVGEIAIQN